MMVVSSKEFHPSGLLIAEDLSLAFLDKRTHGLGEQLSIHIVKI